MAQLWPRWLLFTAVSVVTCAVAGVSVSTEHRGVVAVEAADASGVLPGASSTPNVHVDFGTTTRTIDRNAIGVDETTFGAPLDVNDPTAQQMLSTLGVGYSRIWLRFSNPGDPGSGVVCAASGCDTAISGDTWVTMQKSIGETPVIGIADTMSSADAAALVQHFNVTTGDPVSQWVIGNEPDHSGESAATYSSRFNALYDAMKAVDPAIKIGGGTTAWYDQSFLQSFLQASGDRVDFVDFHWYPGNSTQSDLLAKLSDISYRIGQLRTLINTTVPSRASDIAIHVGEWNISYVASTLAEFAYSGFASAWDADVLGRILSAGADSLAFGTKVNALSVLASPGSGQTLPAGYSADTPMPMYEALGMFTGEGLFPRFGTTMVSATSGLAGVDVFASTSPDDIVLVNTGGAAQNAMIQVKNGGRLTAAAWQIDQTGETPSAPANVSTTTTTNGSFDLSLPADSVTTLVVTAPASSYPSYTTHDAQTGRCLDSNTAGSAYTQPCNGGNYQNWKASGTSLVDQQSGRCLDSNTAGSVYTQPCNGGNYQNWYSLGALLVDAQTGRCLDSNTGGSVYTQPCNGGNYQNWNFMP
jgi:hypothetical protein